MRQTITAMDDEGRVEIGEVKQDTEIQKFMTDPDALKIPFLVQWCGWKQRRVKGKNIVMGQEDETDGGIYYSKPNAEEMKSTIRIMNESCCDYIYNSIMPLITQLATTSNLSEEYIYNSWVAKLFTLRKVYEYNYYVQGNSFEMIMDMMPDAQTTIANLSNITMKARMGFTMRQITETFMSMYSNRIDGTNPIASQQKKKGGLLENVMKGFGRAGKDGE